MGLVKNYNLKSIRIKIALKKHEVVGVDCKIGGTVM